MTPWLLLFVIIGALIAANGVFVAAEFAIISASRPRLETMLAEGTKRARRVLDIVTDSANKDRYIATSQLGLSLTSLGLGMYAEHELVRLVLPWVERLGGSAALAHTVSMVAVLAFLTFWHIVLGEMVPKSIALAGPERIALRLIIPMRALYVVLFPIIWLLNRIGTGVLLLLRLPMSADVSFVYSPEELRLIFEESHEEGLLEREEHRLMQRVIEFGKRMVRQVMVPRVKIVGLPVEATVDEALAQVAREAYTRYPVYEKDMDHIVGIVHVKDLVRSRLRDPGSRSVRDLVRYVPFVPESMWTSELFEKMQAERVQLAVVVDEHGGTAGIATMEDLVEEVFGEVRDEFDAEEEEPIARMADASLRVLGSVPLADLAEALDRDLEYEDVETVNGLVMDLLGRPPRVGDQVEDEHLRLVVERVDSLTVHSARVYDLKRDAEAPPQEAP